MRPILPFIALIALMLGSASTIAQVPDSLGPGLTRVMRLTEHPDPENPDRVVQMAMGGLDFDHDGRKEFLYVTDHTFIGGRETARVGFGLFLFEYNPALLTYELIWRYTLTDTLGASFPVFTIGDLNANGRKEIIVGVQYAAGRPFPGANPERLLVFELGPGFFPTVPVASWNFDAPAGADIRPSALIAGDIDGDGRDELAVAFRIWGGATKGMIITSVEGDFAGPLTTWKKEVYDTTTTTGGIFGTARITDIDNDRRKEATFAFTNGRVFLFEATAADTYTRYFWDLARGTPLAIPSPTGPNFSFQEVDLNRDGRNEFVLGRAAGPTDAFIVSGITALEAFDSTRVARLGRITNHPGTTITEFRGLTAGDFDGNGRTDIFMNNGGRVWRVEYRGVGAITDSASYTWSIAYQDTATGVRFRWVTFTGDVWALSQGITAVDMDDDRRRELIITNQGGGDARTGAAKVVILESTTAVVSVELFPDGLPRTFTLEQNYPNPFNPSTTIPFTLSTAEKVLLEVYDLAGRKVATLVDGRLEAGRHSVVFDASHLASGTYVYVLSAGDHRLSKKMLLVK